MCCGSEGRDLTPRDHTDIKEKLFLKCERLSNLSSDSFAYKRMNFIWDVWALTVKRAALDSFSLFRKSEIVYPKTNVFTSSDVHFLYSNTVLSIHTTCLILEFLGTNMNTIETELAPFLH